MPPGPAFNWICVAHSALDILNHAARYRAAQLSSPLTSQPVQKQQKVNDHVSVRRHERNEEEELEAVEGLTRTDTQQTGSLNAEFEPVLSISIDHPATEQRRVQADSHFVRPDSLRHANEAWISQISISPLPIFPNYPIEPVLEHSNVVTATTTAQPEQPGLTQSELVSSGPPRQETAFPFAPPSTLEASPPPLVEDPNSSLALDAEPIIISSDESIPDLPPARALQSSKVPSSRLGRLFHYGGLAASLSFGAASELVRRSASSSDSANAGSGSLMLTEANVTRLVSKLSQMRGAALKIGQFLSIQDTHVLPPEIERVFRRVQDSAHYMPNWQMEKVLATSLGPSWRTAFSTFDPTPFAAASIGQVHRAVLTADASPTGAEARVAVKIQFPNVRESVETDLSYVSALMKVGGVLPKGAFLGRTIEVMKQELADECDYAREASFLCAFRAPSKLGNDARFKVPWVWDGSTDRVLVMEHVDGTSVGGDAVHALPQEDRDAIAARIIELCLKELFVFRAMQTDPNWSNFLWNARTKQIELVDFGATREYDVAFIDNWLRLLQAAASGDRPTSVERSIQLGYLTGEENEMMLDAHVTSMALLATPFRADTPQPFAFGPGSRWTEVTGEIRSLIPVMLRHRLTPPPRETYSLNRKLSGAFLLASRLGARVDCKTLWDGVVDGYKFTT